MESFSFVIKTVLVTALIIWVCQFKVAEKPVEKHFIEFVRGSTMTEPIHKIAEGSRKLGNDAWAGIQQLISGTTTDTKPTTTRKASAFKWSWGSDQKSEE